MKTKNSNTKELIFMGAFALLLAAGDLFAFPAVLFVNISIADINPIYFTLMVNQWLLIGLGLVAVHFLCPSLHLGLGKDGLKEGMKKYALSGGILSVVSIGAFALGLIGDYNYTPTFWKVLIEGFIYYISVAFIEELYVRGLLLNFLERLLKNKRNATLIAIIVSSLIFSLGHIPGMIGQDALTIVCRLIWTAMLGIFLGVTYKKTNNLWIPIALHTIIDFCGVPFCFTSAVAYPAVSVIVIAIAYVFVGGWSIYDFAKKKEVLK